MYIREMFMAEKYQSNQSFQTMALFRSFVAIALILSVTTASVVKEEGNKHHGSEYHCDHNPNFREYEESAESVESREEKDHSGPYYHGVHNPNFPAPSAENLEVKETEYHNEFNSKEINEHNHHGPSYHGSHNPNFPLNSGEAEKPWVPHHGPGSESHESHSHESHSHEHGHHGFDHKFPFFWNLPFFKPHHDHNSQESGSHELDHKPHAPNFPLNSGEADKPMPPHHGHGSESQESHSHEQGHHGFHHKFPFFGLPFLKPHHGPQGEDSGSNEHGPNHGPGNHFPFTPFNKPNQDGNNDGGFNFPNLPSPSFKPEDHKVADDA